MKVDIEMVVDEEDDE
jgi:hypothetical protein